MSEAKLVGEINRLGALVADLRTENGILQRSHDQLQAHAEKLDVEAQKWAGEAERLTSSLSDGKREYELLESMDNAAMDKMQAMIKEQSERIKALADYAENAARTLRGLSATFETIHDRHVDNQDCDEDADGHRTPNRDMHTVVDCDIALSAIRAALAKNPNPAGPSPTTEASAPLAAEASGAGGAGTLVDDRVWCSGTSTLRTETGKLMQAIERRVEIDTAIDAALDAGYPSKCEHGIAGDAHCAICDADPEPTPMMREAAKLHAELRDKRTQSGKKSDAVREFARCILHGDESHQAWLLGAAEDFLAGRGVGAAPPPDVRGPLGWLDDAIRDLCEIPDRDSPDDFPEALLVTCEEVRDAVERHLPRFPQVGKERTDADYAIEFGGYLATAVKNFMQSVAAVDVARQRHEDAEPGAEAAEAYDVLHGQEDLRSERWDGLRSAVYEFEKRRDRALAADCPIGSLVETRRYADGTMATGAPPLPDHSPDGAPEA